MCRQGDRKLREILEGGKRALWGREYDGKNGGGGSLAGKGHSGEGL